MQYSWRLSNILCEAWMVSSKPSQRGAFIQNPALSRCLLGSLATVISIRKQGNLKNIQPDLRSMNHGSAKGPNHLDAGSRPPVWEGGVWQYRKARGIHIITPLRFQTTPELLLKGADEQSWAVFPELPPSHRHMPRFVLFFCLSFFLNLGIQHSTQPDRN